MTFSITLLINAGYITAAFFVIMIISFLLSKAACRVISLEKSRTYLFTFMLLFSNTGFMGIPISHALYGKEGVFYAVLMDALCNIFIYTAGIMLIKKSTGTYEKAAFRELLSPGFISILIGILLFATNTKLPFVLGDSVAMIGAATAPLAMLMLGFQLGKIHIRELVGDLSIYLLAGLKLIVIPLIFTLFFIGLFENPSLFVKVIILEISMPVAASTVIFTQRYDGDITFTSKGVLLTTAISIITIPIFAVIVN